MDYSESLVALIDSRIDQAMVKPTKMGTVQGRESGTVRAIVSFDGSAGVGQPVKCFEGVVVDLGDRVGLIKFEGEWVIVANYTLRTYGDSLVGTDMTSTTSITGTGASTFIDVPSSARANMVKYRDSTQLQIFVAISLVSTVAATVVEIGVNITLPDGSNFDQALYHRAINAANDHRDMSGGITTPGLTLPGGSYAITGRWRRSSGTGTLTMDANDSCTIWVREVAG